MEKEKTKIRTMFYALFGILGFFILLTPHMIAGHFFVSEKYAQSLMLLTIMIVGYFFYGFYRRKIEGIYNEKIQAEKRLSHSYSYIGKINNIVDVFKKFGRIFPQKHTETKEDEIFNTLLSNMVVSVSKSEKGFLRFIDVENGRTLKEFYFSKNGNDLRVKVSNNAVLEQKYEHLDGVLIIESDYKNTGVCCIICVTKTNNIDVELIKPLLNQTHLLYLVFNKKMTQRNYATQSSTSRTDESFRSRYDWNEAQPRTKWLQ